MIEGDWFDDQGRPHHTGEVYFNGKGMWEVESMPQVVRPGACDWSCSTRTVRGGCGTARADDVQPRYLRKLPWRKPKRALVEINVRDSCFYPDTPGVTISPFVAFAWRTPRPSGPHQPLSRLD